MRHPARDPSKDDIVDGCYRIIDVYPGGMGIVFSARDTESGKIYALKTPRWPTSEDLRQQFEEEALYWISLPSSDHIVSAYRVFLDEDRPYLVMEYIDGGSLDDRLVVSGVNRDDAIRFACQLCIGMSALSDLGERAHLDLKPKNLLISSDGTLKIADFGLAKLTDPFRGSPAHETNGSYLYASPEQFLGLPVDTRSDIFSFGVLLYQLLTGKLPYPIRLTGDWREDSARIELYHQIMHEPAMPALNLELGAHQEVINQLREWDRGSLIRSPLEFGPLQSLDSETAPIVARCIREFPRDRWPNFGELGKALSEIAPPDLYMKLYVSDGPFLPSDPLKWFLLGVSHYNLGRHDGAVRYFNQFLARVPPGCEQQRDAAMFLGEQSFKALEVAAHISREGMVVAESGAPPEIDNGGAHEYEMDGPTMPERVRSLSGDQAAVGVEGTDDRTQRLPRPR